jgi:Ca-activated chloride channel family protein
MAAIAQESNGKHWFLPDASALAGVFQEELGALQTAVATGAELSIEPASGVVIQDVLDRPFRREGGRVVVQLGTFDPRQEKTVLLRAQVPSDGDGAEPVAKLALAYRDVTQRLDARCGGSLELQVRSDGSAQPEIDPFVAARLERSRTARTLTDANDLFEHGKGDEARARLAERRSELSKVEGPAKLGARAAATSAGGLGGMIGRRSLDADFSEQESVIEQAQSGFAPPPPSLPVGHGGSLAAGAPAASPAAKSAVRSNQANAVDLAF